MHRTSAHGGNSYHPTLRAVSKVGVIQKVLFSPYGIFRVVRKECVCCFYQHVVVRLQAIDYTVLKFLFLLYFHIALIKKIVTLVFPSRHWL